MPGYKLKDLKYIVVLPQRRAFRKGAERGKFIDAAGDGFAMFMNGAFNIAVKRNVDRKLEEMYPDIKKTLVNHTGVMVVVQYQQWKAGNPEFNPPELLSIMIGPAASNLPSAIRRWEQMSKLMQGPDDGKVFGPRNYLWFTKDSGKKENLKKAEVLNQAK
ncbi:MAG: hypothetical protein PVH87_14595 [Desulfobacteraceae bacterium]